MDSAPSSPQRRYLVGALGLLSLPVITGCALHEGAAGPNAEMDPSPRTVLLPGGVVLNIVAIRPGRFVMGSPISEPGRKDDETQHEAIS